MSFRDHLDRLHEAVMDHLADHVSATYTPSIGAPIEAPVVFERDFEVYDQDQVAMRVTTISVRVSDVSESRTGDTVDLPDRTWKVQQILEDDGHMRRLMVS